MAPEVFFAPREIIVSAWKLGRFPVELIMSTALPAVTAAAITSNGCKTPWDGTANMLDGSAATANVAAGLTGASDYVDLTMAGMPPSTARSVVSFTLDIRVSATISS